MFSDISQMTEGPGTVSEVLRPNRATCQVFPADLQGSLAGCCLTERHFGQVTLNSRLLIIMYDNVLTLKQKKNVKLHYLCYQ